MKRFTKALMKSIRSVYRRSWYALEKNLFGIGCMLEVLSFFIMSLLVQRNVEQFILQAIFISVLPVGKLLQMTANNLNVGCTMPMHTKKFTLCVDDEITANKKDLQEILIYLSQVEDYALRQGHKYQEED